MTTTSRKSSFAGIVFLICWIRDRTVCAALKFIERKRKIGRERKEAKFREVSELVATLCVWHYLGMEVPVPLPLELKKRIKKLHRSDTIRVRNFAIFWANRHPRTALELYERFQIAQPKSLLLSA